MKQLSSKIGIFDSGKGGLSVVKEVLLMSKLLNLDIEIDFIADTRNFPYGVKTKSELEKIIRNNVKTLAREGNKTIIVACNTASIAGKDIYDDLEKEYNLPIIKVTEGVMSAYDAIRKMKSIFVIGTEFTIHSQYYQRLLQEMNPSLHVVGSVEQRLVRYIELNRRSLITKELEKIKEKMTAGKCDTILLGCTHYSFIKKHFHQVMPHVRIIDPSHLTASKFVHSLVSEELTHHQQDAHPVPLNESDLVANYTLESLPFVDLD